MLKKKGGGGYFVQNSLLIQQNLRIKLHFLIPKYVWGQKCCNKREGISYRIQPSQFEIIPEIEKYNSSFQKIFPTKNDGQKKGGGYIVQNSLLFQQNLRIKLQFLGETKRQHRAGSIQLYNFYLCSIQKRSVV